MNKLYGTKTEANLLTAFSGESQANTKYTFYAHKARKDGYNQIADIFEETANNERAHAQIWFKYLHNNDIPETKENLTDAIEGECFEWNNMYPEFERVAREEGFEDLAVLFKMVGDIEAEHEKRFKKLLQNVESSLVFSKDGEAIWQCLNCGNIIIGKSAPLVCPVCKQNQAYFQIKPENY
jgi:rubrerythrin